MSDVFSVPLFYYVVMIIYFLRKEVRDMWSEEREIEREIERCGDPYRAEQLAADLMMMQDRVRERRARYGKHE